MQNLSYKTQISSTFVSYKKIADLFLEDKTVDILDYGAGLGLGFDCLVDADYSNVECYEPYPYRWRSKNKSKPFYTNPDEITKQYDFIFCIYVLNVLVLEDRLRVVNHIKSLMRVGSRVCFVVRGHEVVNNLFVKKNRSGEEAASVFICSKSGEHYQKGFSLIELSCFLKDIFPFDCFDVYNEKQFNKLHCFVKRNK